MSEEKTHSYHIFLYPFRWKRERGNRLSDFDKLLENYWDAKSFDVKGNYLNYNEYVYFHKFARDAIYFEENTNQNSLRTYQLKDDFTSPKYVIEHYRKSNKKIIKEDGENKIFKYTLGIDKIELKVYEAGVGVLAFFLKNTRVSDLEHILAINEFGRRTYTPFYTAGFKTEETKKALLAHKITVKLSDKVENIFSHKFGDEKYRKPIVPKFISELFPENFITEPAVDDRMFVISWFGNNDLANRLTEKNKEINEYKYQNSEDWYKYVFIDNDMLTCQNDQMKQELIKKHTYTRWANYNTLYGLTRYSFVCMTSDLKALKENDAEFIPDHIQTMYYQIVALSLMQRASILHFSDEVTEISKLDKDEDIQLAKIQELNKEYLKFSNQFYFREVTAQDQGIELYDMLQEKMRIERDVKDLNREIDELYQYANLLEDKKERKQMNTMQRWGGFLLLPALIAGIFGMNTLPQTWLDAGNTDMWISFVSIIILPILIFGIPWLIKTIKTNKNEKTNI